MKIIVSGSSGLIGSALVPFLRDKGHHVITLVRDYNALSPDKRLWNSEKGEADFSDLERLPEQSLWDPEKGEMDISILEGADAVINLAGENIANHRWTSKIKSRLRRSRIHSTRTLVDAFPQLKNPPKTLISTSAIGFYGNRGLEPLTEASPGGTGFLSELSREWENMANCANSDKTRVVLARFGGVLSRNGGALKKMIEPFKLGLGGVLGKGTQVMSWIAIDDVVAALLFLLDTSTIKGPVNIVSPHPVTNAEFTKAVAEAMHKKAFLKVPAFALKVMFGQIAEDVLLSSLNVVPEKLLKAHFSFRYPELEPFLQKELSSP